MIRRDLGDHDADCHEHAPNDKEGIGRLYIETVKGVDQVDLPGPGVADIINVNHRYDHYHECCH